ncbi:MAG: cytochrome c [Myxococcales bacterium]|nr:cytochrome c [Myxococcales bacterium]
MGRRWGWVVAAGLLGCTPALVRPDAEDVAWASGQWPGTTLQDLESGRDRYVRRCAGCHTLYVPDAYPPARWPHHVDTMAERSRLAPGERDLIVRYLSVASHRPASARLPAPAP